MMQAAFFLYKDNDKNSSICTWSSVLEICCMKMKLLFPKCQFVFLKLTSGVGYFCTINWKNMIRGNLNIPNHSRDLQSINPRTDYTESAHQKSGSPDATSKSELLPSVETVCFTVTVEADDGVHAKLAIWSRCSNLIRHFYCGLSIASISIRLYGLNGQVATGQRVREV